eukprot:9483081-Pyramimonas_sp.AAC.1
MAELVPQAYARQVLVESDQYLTPEACAALLPPSSPSIRTTLAYPPHTNHHSTSDVRCACSLPN